jgi:uracil-DNA glycosylase family 4
MRWTERQRAMLREMGVPPFWPQEAAPEPEPVAATSSESARLARPSGPDMPAPHSPALALPNRPGAADNAAGQGLRQAPQPARPVEAPSAAPIRVDKVLAKAGVMPGAVAAPALMARRPDGIEQMDWPALRAAVSQCQACELCKSRTQPVFGVGHPQAEWMLIGEAPGEQEDKQGEPFVGRAGQLLDRMLAAVALTRAEAAPAQQVFIANVLKCRPPANRNPQPQEVAQCEPYLLRQIELVRPKVIVAMGRFAAQSVLKSSEPIGKLRGKVHEVAGVPVIVTYHPAYLLRSPADKALAWDDLCLAREVWAKR